MKYLKLNKNFSQIQQAFNNNQRIVLRYNNSIIGELINLYQYQTLTKIAPASHSSKTVSFKLVNFITDYSFNPKIYSNINLSSSINFSTLDQTDIEGMEYYGIIIPNWEEENLYNMELFTQTLSK